MKSLINGLGSGFGRAIGRIIAYILIGVLAVLFLQKNEVHVIDYINPVKWFFLDASASSIYSDEHGCVSGFYDIEKQNGDISYGQISTSYNIAWDIIYFSGTENLDANSYYDMKIVFRSNPSLSSFSDGDPEIYKTSSLCGNWSQKFQVSSFGISGSTLTIRFLTGTSMVDYWGVKLFYNYTGSQGINSVTLSKVDLSGSSGIIENNNNNTNTIINNNNENTQDIIDNQVQNTQDIINAIDNNNYSVCSKGKQYFLIGSDKSYISNNLGQVNTNNNYFVSSPLRIESNKSYTLNIVNATNIQYGYYCFYRSDKTLVSCTKYNDNSTLSYTFTSPNDSYYFIATLYRTNDVILNAYLEGKTSNICVTDSYNSAIISQKNNISLDDLNDKQQDTNDLLTDDNIDEDLGSSFFDDFENNDFGLSDIITIPLDTIQTLTSKACIPLTIPIPYTNRNIQLPCMTQIYQSKLPTIYNLWKIVSFGIISYYIAIDIFHLVKGFKDPESDKVEVLDL